jgi:hypothetical protein
MADKNERHRPLLSRRVPRDEIRLGHAYVIHARNGGVGVAVHENGVLGYRLHRVQFETHYLFVEYDWEDDDRFGTAIPLARITEPPPSSEEALLPWLREQEIVHEAEIGAAWSVVLDHHVTWKPES